MRRAHGGFSLIEMLVVIAILGVMAAIAFPSFTYLSSTTKIKGASTELYLALIRARNEAVKRNRLVSITSNADGWQAGWQIVADINSDGAFNSADRVIVNAGPLRRVTVTSEEASVVFLTSGRIKGDLPILEVSSEETPSMKRCISTDLTGRPYAKEGACP